MTRGSLTIEQPGAAATAIAAVPSRRAQYALAVRAVVESHRSLAAASARHADLIEEARLAGAALHSTDSFTGGPQWSSEMVVERQIVTELAVALHQSEGDTRRLLHTAEAMAGSFSATRTALESGAISYRHAEKIVQHSNTLPVVCLEAYESALLPLARTVTVQRLERLARAAVEEAQPTTAVQRHLDAVARRRLDLDPASNGMAYLTHFIPAVEAVAIYNRADDLARSAKNAGDPRTITHLRVDTLTDLLLNGEPGIDGISPGIRARIHVTVPALTLLAPAPVPPAPVPPAPIASGSPAPASLAPTIPSAAPITSASPTPASITSVSPAPNAPNAAAASASAAPSTPTYATRAAPSTPTYATRAAPDCPAASRCPGAGIATTPAPAPAPDGRIIDTRIDTVVSGAPETGSNWLTTDEPGFAQLEGYGPIDRLTALQVTRNAPNFMRVLTDPITGCVLNFGRQRYKPPAELDELIRLTYAECTFPVSCDSSATADLDHTVAWSDGGPTELRNISPLCSRHHKMKHHTEWTIEQSSDGTITWGSPAGFEYIVEPTPLVRPGPRFDSGPVSQPPF